MSQETNTRQRRSPDAGVAIRGYCDEDWSVICRIHDRARPDELEGSCDPRAFVPIEQDSEVEDLHRAEKLVAADGDRVVGFVGIDGTCLAWLYVDPDYYGRGIGRALLRRGLEEIGLEPGPSCLMATYEPAISMRVRVSRRHGGSTAKTPATLAAASAWSG